MVRCAVALIATLAALVGYASARGDLVVPEWTLGVQVYDSQDSTQDFSVLSQVQNDFVGLQSATIPPSTSMASYEAAWTGDFFSFAMGITQHVEFLFGDSNAFGHINVVPMVDSILTLDASYAYDLPASPGAAASLSVLVFRPDPLQVLFNQVGSQSNISGPASGTLMAHSDGITLIAG